MQLRSIAPTERIRGIDIARGLALLGILLVNVRFFFAPLASGLRPMRVESMPVPDALDIAAWAGVEVFATFKFISLFSMMFGFGLALQAGRAQSAGRSRWPVGLRRLAVLLALGLVHGLLVWYGDILTLYSVLGVGVLAALALPAPWLRRAFTSIAVGLVAGSVVVAALQYSAETLVEPGVGTPPATTEPATNPRGWAAIAASQLDIGSDLWIEAEIAANREGPMADAFAFRAMSYAVALGAAPFGYGWHAFAMMLFGAWACRTGLFGAEAGASSRRRRIAAIGLGFGLPLAVAAVAPWFIWGLEDPRSAAAHTVLLELGALLLPLGYACTIVEFGPRLPRWIAVSLERTGRMAMTVYLCESLACVALASWWGAGWFATMQDGRLTLIALSVWALLVLGANLWLSRFRTGPMEWIWRRLSYGRIPAEVDVESRQGVASL